MCFARPVTRASGEGNEVPRIAVRAVVAVSFVVLAAALSAPAALGELTTVGLRGWQVQSSGAATQSGARISRPGFLTTSWLHVRPDDAGAVGSEVGALVQNGRCPNVFFSTRMKTCFGYMGEIGPDTIARFSVPWWFRTEFTTRLPRSGRAQLIINGVVGETDVWVNGSEVTTGGHGSGRLHEVHVRHHALGSSRRERGRAEGLSE